MQITLRRCGPDDAEALALVGQATFLESYADDLDGEDILAHCRSEHGPDRYAGFLAGPAYALWGAQAPGGALVGYAVVCPPDLPIPTDAGDVELKRLYLLHRFHGGGTGWRLITTAMYAARAGGSRRLLVGVYSKNESAIAFYARQGFSPAGVRKFRVGAQVHDDLVMALQL